MHLGVGRLIHLCSVFLAEDYAGSFDAIFTQHRLPDEPSFYVNVPSRVDPSAAPEGDVHSITVCLRV